LADRTAATAPGWLQPVPEQQGLSRYLETVRERLWIVLLATVLCVGAAVAYVVTADEVYEATADVLITPVPTESETLISLGLLRETNDPAREVDTATQLITTRGVAQRVSEELGGGQSPESLLDDVEANPVASSNIVAVTARAESPTEAQELANAFAAAAVEQRTDQLHAKIDEVLPRLESQLSSLPADELTAQELAGEVAQLETLAAGPDPTMRLETPAAAPDDPVWPKVVLTLVVAGLVGLVLGILTAFGLRVLDPRLRREEQLGQVFRLPVLARIPRETARSRKPLPRERLSAPAVEAYRTLRTTLTAARPSGDARSILVTGPSAGGGKTTTALNLAISLTAAGHRVILIEGDVRRPSLGGALGIETDRGLVSVMIEESSLADALVTTDAYGPNLELLLAEATGPAIAELISLPVASGVVDASLERADYVIVDSPPLTQVIDALPLAAHVDDVLIVVRLGQSHLRQIKELGELLAGAGITPAGVAIVGTTVRARAYYRSYYDEPGRFRRRRRSQREAAGRVVAGSADRSATG
jgi:succinoglycan biosynthesis transport protein ExoP